MIQQHLRMRYIKKDVLKTFLKEKWPSQVSSMEIEEVDADHWKVKVPSQLSEADIRKLQRLSQ